ncbi:MAG: dihydropteroate synthase [Acidobacteria bacterium]|nr:dihydropteroate synthase [Acidobacteriota bacterium]
MARKRFIWKAGARELQLGDRTAVMGILNITPDSFSDGGMFESPEAAYARAMEIEQQGADVIDIGAESTRPGSSRISEEDEWARLQPVLKRLRNKLTIPVSVDTYKSSVAAKALELGAEVINDPSGLTFDPMLAKVAIQYNAGLILNHMRGTPETWAKLSPLPDPLATIIVDLRASIHRARRDGVDGMRIVIDPGIGFGKRKEENFRILGQLQRLQLLEAPVLVGPSRKRFLGDAKTEDLVPAGAAAVASAILNGAHLVRVHDVAQMIQAVNVADSILRELPPEPEPEPRRPVRDAGPHGRAQR